MTTYQKLRPILEEQIHRGFKDFGPQTLVSDFKLDEVDMIQIPHPKGWDCRWEHSCYLAQAMVSAFGCLKSAVRSAARPLRRITREPFVSAFSE